MTVKIVLNLMVMMSVDLMQKSKWSWSEEMILKHKCWQNFEPIKDVENVENVMWQTLYLNLITSYMKIGKTCIKGLFALSLMCIIDAYANC